MDNIYFKHTVDMLIEYRDQQEKRNQTALVAELNVAIKSMQRLRSMH